MYAASVVFRVRHEIAMNAKALAGRPCVLLYWRRLLLQSSRQGGRQVKVVFDSADTVVQVFFRGLPGSNLLLPSIKDHPLLDCGKRSGLVPAVKPGSRQIGRA